MEVDTKTDMVTSTADCDSQRISSAGLIGAYQRSRVDASVEHQIYLELSDVHILHSVGMKRCLQCGAQCQHYGGVCRAESHCPSSQCCPCAQARTACTR